MRSYDLERKQSALVESANARCNVRTYENATMHSQKLKICKIAPPEF